MIAPRTGVRRPRTKRAPVDERSKADNEYCEALQNAWRTSDTIPPTGDRWTDAVVAAGNGVDIEPLANYLEDVAGGRESALTQYQLNNLVSLVRLLHARGQKQGRGKPSGTHRRCSNPNYVATQFAEVRIAIWERANGKRNIPDAVRDKTIAATVAEISKWSFAKRKPPSVSRVKALLAGPRSRRLPVIVPGLKNFSV
jgi:hypothetical protein